MPEERKLVTVLFADIVGSTSLTVERDPEVMRAALRRTFDELRPIVELHGGTVEKFIGDEVMAVFGVPQVHDDDADRAVRAAFAMRAKVQELTARPKAVPLHLRIGINSGEAVAGAGEGSQFLVTGEPVIAAARIRGSAEPGQIVVGALTHRLTQRLVEYGGPSEFEAKGLGRLSAWPALSLRTTEPAQSRGIEGLRAPLIGRDEELSLLLNAFERVSAEGRPHLITVFGAAGAGKSRLANELIARLGRTRIRVGRCLPYGEGITLWPVQNILRADCGIAPSDDLASAKRRLHDAVSAVFPADADDVDAVRRRLEVLAGLERADEALPDVAAADLSEELAWGLRRYLEKRAGSEPLVLVFEDIHWAAPALLELIDHLAEWAKAPLFILCLARPEFLDSRPGWGGGKVNAATVVLEPLTADETRELVARLLDIDALNEGVRASVVERAEGNPLYVEEFIRLLIESGQIGQREGRWIALGGGPLQVPPTLQGLIAARIDTAPGEVKALLQRAAVIGRQFPTTGIAALSDGKPPETTQLRDAVRRDLLVDVDERGVGGGRVYRFKHVLIRDVAYASVPKADRAVYHDRYARWYEDTLGDRREDFIELIAHHAEQAYLLASEMGLASAAGLARRAFERLMHAATKARWREDDAASLDLHRRVAAVAADADLSERERLELDAYLALARYRVEATTKAADAVDAAIERARSSGANDVVLELLGVRIRQLGQHEAEPARTELRSLALASGEPKHVVRAFFWRITPTSTMSEDVAFLKEALAYAEAHRLDVWRRRALRDLTLRLAWQLQFTESDRRRAEWQRSLGATPSRRDRADLLFATAERLIQIMDHGSVLAVLDEYIGLCASLGDLRAEMLGKLLKAHTLASLGRPQEAIAACGEVIVALEGKVAPGLNRASRISQSRFLAAAGRVTEARSMLEQALAFPSMMPVDRSALWGEAIVLAAEGELERAAEVLAEAARDLRDLGEDNDPRFVFERAGILRRAGRAGDARDILVQFRLKLTDPLAQPLRDRIDGFMSEMATAAGR